MRSLLNATLGDCKIKLIFLLMQPKMYYKHPSPSTIFCGSQKIVLGEIRAMQVYTMTKKIPKKYLHSTISYRYKIVL